jgi:hypothetical protein
MFGLFKKKPPPLDRFPPVPKWRPSFQQPIETIVDRVACYTNKTRDFAVFRYGTCALLPRNQIADDEAIAIAKDVLEKIFRFHADMNPSTMDDGNIAIQYNHPAINVVLRDFAELHWVEIDRNHQGALATSEVLITPQGPNKFDDFGKKALFGRCFMFMDAQAPEVIRIVRAAV